MKPGATKTKDQEPRFQALRDVVTRHQAIFTGIGITVVVSLVAFLAYQSRTQEERVDTLERGAPCRPDRNNQPAEPQKCKESFSQAVKTLTPEQACRIVRKGATLLLVNGERITSVECIPPPRAKRNKEEETSRRRAFAVGFPSVFEALAPTSGESGSGSGGGRSPDQESTGNPGGSGGTNPGGGADPAPEPEAQPEPEDPKPGNGPPEETPPSGGNGNGEGNGGGGEGTPGNAAVEVDVPGLEVGVCTKPVKLNCDR